jgi:hypothetical protein
MAVVVNGLVNSVTVIKAAARLLETYWEQLAEHDRASMLHDITRHADLIAGVLADVAHELPAIGDVAAEVIDLRPEPPPATSDRPRPRPRPRKGVDE